MQQQIGFSYVEVHYLLGVVDTEAGERTRARFGLYDFDNPQQLAAIGASALLARGLLGASDDNESVVPVDEAMFVSYVLLNAVRWSTFQSTDGAANGDTGFLIESDLGSVLAQPRALDTWWFVLIDSADAGNDVIVAMVTSLAEEGDKRAIFLRSETADYDRSFTLVRDNLEWSFALGATGTPDPDQRVDATDRAAVLAALHSFAHASATS
jgi:hypothetical protein